MNLDQLLVVMFLSIGVDKDEFAFGFATVFFSVCIFLLYKTYD